jgi:hypothetical protein
VRRAETVGDVGGPVGRAVVDDDQLPLAAREGLRQTIDEQGERTGFVVRGDDDGDERVVSLFVALASACLRRPAARRGVAT